MDLNHRPIHYEWIALPTELHRHFILRTSSPLHRCSCDGEGLGVGQGRGKTTQPNKPALQFTSEIARPDLPSKSAQPVPVRSAFSFFFQGAM